MISNLLLAPIRVPAIVLGFALLYYLVAMSFGLSFLSLLVAHTVAGILYIVRTVLATYRGVPAELEECASILGANRWQIASGDAELHGNQFDPSIAAISTVQMVIAVTALLVLDRIYGVERLTAV